MLTRPRSHPALGHVAGRLLALLGGGLALSLVTAWVYSSYFQIDVVGSLIWPGSDGYCVEGAESLGVHCFSDVSQFLLLGESMDPEGSNPFIRNYPPINRTIFWVFQMFAVHVGYTFALALYVAISAACLLVPIIWAVSRRSWTEQVLIVGLAGVATFPFLATLDRGNNIALAVPFVWLAALGIRRANNPMTIIGIVGASQIKPQFGALVLALLVVRRFRAAIITVIIGIALFLASFLLVLLSRPALSPVQEFKDFILYTRFYDQYLPLDGTYPPNASFGHLVALLNSSVGSSMLSETSIQVLVAVLVLGLLAAIIWRGGRFPMIVWFASILMAISLTPAISFAYYLAGALVIAAFIFRDATSSDLDSAPSWVGWLLTVALVASLTPLLIPLGAAEAPVPVLGDGVQVSLLPRLAAVLWVAFIAAIAVASVARGRRAAGVGD